MASEAQVVLEPAGPQDERLLANLLELYSHDLSEVFDIEPGPDGRFGYEYLPLYWTEPDRRFPFLIRSGTRIVGFVLAMRGSPVMDDPDVLDIAEFFVLRRHRRSGIGRRAAFLLWDRLPGRWTVRVSEENRAALPFWSKVIAEYSGGTAVEARPPGWRVFCFTNLIRIASL